MPFYGLLPKQFTFYSAYLFTAFIMCLFGFNQQTLEAKRGRRGFK